MSFEVRDGWIYGYLPGPKSITHPRGRYRVKHFPQPPYVRLAEVTPQCVLHTTETDGYIAQLRYPSQFQVGEGFIGQHKPLWAKGEALVGDMVNDPYGMQIEIVGHSKLTKWLPARASLHPLLALVAFLHEHGYIQTGLRRPVDFPVVLDRGPQASESYYRRSSSGWPTKAGVYGHVDIPGNSHWDPGSFDYPEFFSRVQDLLPKPRYFVRPGGDPDGYRRWRPAQKTARRQLRVTGDEVTIRLREVIG